MKTYDVYDKEDLDLTLDQHDGKRKIIFLSRRMRINLGCGTDMYRGTPVLSDNSFGKHSTRISVVVF